MPKPPQPCIFCGRYGFKTKEHVLAKWLEEIFPRTPSDTHSKISTNWIREGKVENSQVVTSAQGRTHAKQRRVVCLTCNNGWMGANQNDTKNILASLIRGDTLEISEKQQRDISVWATRTAMVAEFIDEVPACIPQSQRTWLMEKLEPPPGWFIWVAGYGGNWPLEYMEVLSREAGVLTPPIWSAPPGPFHVHSITIGLGRLLIYVAAIDVPDQHFEITEGLMWPIWPQQGKWIYWLPNRLASDEEVVYLAKGLLREFPINVPRGWGMPNWR